jgi:hypothetical protein
MKRPKIQLAKVKNATGRVDVAAYRIAERLMEKLERERGLVGIRERLLPIVENAIQESLPIGNVLPAELLAILNVCMDNRGRLR